MFAKFDENNEFLRKSLLAEERLRILAGTLIGAKNFCVDLQDKDIVAILRAHAGYAYRNPKPTDIKAVQESKDIEAVHKQAAELTLEDLGLKTENGVKKFFSDLLKLGADVRNLARNSRILEVSKLSMARFFKFDRVREQLRL